MRLPVYGLVALGMAIAESAACAQYQVGDEVIVVWDTQLKVGAEPIQNVYRGAGFTVEAVNGDWLWVSSEATGWVASRNVAAPANAIALFTGQIGQNPYDLGAFEARGRAWRRQGQLDQAILDLTEVLRLNPAAASALSVRGQCWARKGELDQAIADFTLVIQIDPRAVITYCHRASAWLEKRDLERAIADTSEAIRLVPQCHYAYEVRGKAWARSQQYDQAISDWTEALRIDAKSPGAHGQLAWLFASCPEAKFRDGVAAVEQATKACESTGWKNPALFETLAAAYAESGNFAQAVRWQTEAIAGSTAKDQAGVRSRLALFQAGRPYRDTPQN
jgi:tetratricopeptide (TPR) repeat protein